MKWGILAAILVGGFVVAKTVFKPVSQAEPQGGAEAGKAPEEWTLPRKEGGLLLVKSSDGGAVAQICSGQLRWPPNKRLEARTLALKTPVPSQTEFLVYPEFNGCVRVGLPQRPDSKQAVAFENLARIISEKQRTRVVLVITERNIDQGQYAIFENGMRRFLGMIRYTTSSRTTPEKSRVEGASWLADSGFKPESSDFDKFTMLEANRLTRFLGLDVSKAPETAVVALMIVPVR
jgi:hypothetical protein